jgi:hypothetical protein
VGGTQNFKNHHLKKIALWNNYLGCLWFAIDATYQWSSVVWACHFTLVYWLLSRHDSGPLLPTCFLC